MSSRLLSARPPSARPLLARPSALGLVSTLALAAATLALSACDRLPAYDGPELSAFERQQHERCVSLLRSSWQGAPVRSTSAERGLSGLEYVWVNVDVDDDQDDIDRRAAKGTAHAGHCQFEHGADVVHVHSYALSSTPGASAQAAPAVESTDDSAAYRYFTASVQGSALPAMASAEMTR